MYILQIKAPRNQPDSRFHHRQRLLQNHVQNPKGQHVETSETSRPMHCQTLYQMKHQVRSTARATCRLPKPRSGNARTANPRITHGKFHNWTLASHGSRSSQQGDHVLKVMNSQTQKINLTIQINEYILIYTRFITCYL